MVQEQLLRLSEDNEQEAIAGCLAALRAGGMVVIPTETVYGVGILPVHSAALRTIKPDSERPFSLAVDGVERLGSDLLPLGRPALRLAERWWPGPLTQVLPDRRGGTIGVRVPRHAWVRRLLSALGEPLLLSSANRPGEPAPTSLAEISSSVREAVDMLIDGGPIEAGVASSVVAPGLAGLRLLRTGALSRTELGVCAAGRVVVVCSGNTCRSPMAAALLNRAFQTLAERSPDLLVPEVIGAGLHAGPGAPASPGASACMTRRGLDLSSHSSRALDADMVHEADVLLGMTSSHVMTLLTVATEGQTVALFDPHGDEVPDPFGGSIEIYEECAAHLEAVALSRARSILPLGVS
jgi:tRNA threonylcarbamoyl adenosine modification protein (Sua5/YciO/YrdC/YwlC family)